MKIDKFKNTGVYVDLNAIQADDKKGENPFYAAWLTDPKDPTHGFFPAIEHVLRFTLLDTERSRLSDTFCGHESPLH